MKHLVLFSIALIAIGCTTNDKTGAGVAGPLSPPPPAMSTVSSDAHLQATSATDSSANGGSSLPASAPYKGEGAPVPQSLNPAPFLIAEHPQGQPPGAVSATASTLTSRADGTMIGPNDLPAASTGWGTRVPSSVPPNAPRTKAAPRKQQ